MVVVVEEVVDKEMTKVVEEVNRELVKEVNEGLVLVCRYGDGCRGHIGRAVRFVDFIARFSTDLVYFSYRSSHLSLPIFVTAKSCL